MINPSRSVSSLRIRVVRSIEAIRFATEEKMILNISIGKGAGELEVDTEKFSQEIGMRLLAKGIEARLYASHSDVKKDMQGAAAAARKAATEELERLYEGNWNEGRVRGTSPIESKALELASSEIALRLKKGLKISKDGDYVLEKGSEAEAFFIKASQSLKLSMETPQQLKNLHAAMKRSHAKNPRIVAEATRIVEEAKKNAEEIEF